MRRFAIVLIAVLVLGIGSLALAGGSTTKSPKNKKGQEKPAIDWSQFNRKLDVRGIDGQLVYAGFVLHRDKGDRPVVTWMALQKAKSGMFDTLYIDGDNDMRFTKDEMYACKPGDGKSENLRFELPVLKTGHETHKTLNFSVIKNDPLQGGFSMSIWLRGSYDNFMLCGWNSKTSKMACFGRDMDSAPIYDMVVLDEILIDIVEPRIPMQGFRSFMFSLHTHGSTPDAVATLGMKRVPEKDFKVIVTYPKAGDKPGLYEGQINHVC